MKKNVLLALALLTACTRAAVPGGSSSASRKPVAFTAADLSTLAGYMAGNYSSAAQAAADKDYRDIRLHIARLTGPRFGEGVYFYVEQAIASAQDAPYRQRIYHLTRHDDGRFESAVFTLRGPSRFVGAWQNPAAHPALAALTPDSLVLKTGCSVWLAKFSDGTFVGATEGQKCPSELRGAAYATSEVTISATQLRSWDRGYDAAGKQVWGAEKGGYVFDKAK
ncbi:chromophore lyase CpcT/CpeT [Hymenobacter saemangeumensis]|uniref:Chromophore lyase CpcT/CpeT n=1 Tax=Hymenobacter saemangeumensis TaxID=1084522 RepID=A0ABP8ICY3_9BACT